MPKYWVKNYFTHGRFPQSGSKAENGGKKEKKRDRKLVITMFFPAWVLGTWAAAAELSQALKKQFSVTHRSIRSVGSLLQVESMYLRQFLRLDLSPNKCLKGVKMAVRKLDPVSDMSERGIIYTPVSCSTNQNESRSRCNREIPVKFSLLFKVLTNFQSSH